MQATLEIVLRLPELPPRPADGHKGTFGRVLLIAGSRGMSGAAVLCGSGALRAGAGLVRVAVPADVLAPVAAGNPCYTTAPVPCDAEGRLDMTAERALLSLAEANDVVALGPGLGRSPALVDLVKSLVLRVKRPLVLDADGLNALEGQTEFLRRRPAPTILTPHPGEFARLAGQSTTADAANRQEAAVRFAREHQVIVLLKGQGTVITDGARCAINMTGNPGMATGGTGDVLTGVIAALVGQGLSPFAAAQLGAHLHGKAGDLARNMVGEVSLIATDLLEYLPAAFRSLQKGERPA